MVVLDCAISSEFKGYRHGVFSYTKKEKETPKEGERDRFHAVTIIGYDKMWGKKVWIIRNSWSTTWGYDVVILFNIIFNFSICHLTFNDMYFCLRALLRAICTWRETSTHAKSPTILPVQLFNMFSSAFYFYFICHLLRAGKVQSINEL